MDEYYSIVFVYHKQMTWITQVYTHTYIFFSYSSVDGHLGCFHVLAIVNSAAVNIGHCLQYFQGNKTGVGCHFLLQGIFLTWGLAQHLQCCQVDSLALSHQEAP